jgi:CO/xanthine dehydrogenase Mo-binding subunit
VKRSFDYVGKSVPRVDGAEKVTGKAVYAYDVRLPGMLHAKVKRSPYPHARVVRIDSSRAFNLRGVRAIITGKDVPKRLYGKGVRDAPVLASGGAVRFIGEPVAAVAAETEEIAAEAVDLIQVEYEELPAVFDVEEAYAQNPKVIVHPNLRDYVYVKSGPYAINLDPSRPNVNHHWGVISGNVEEGFRNAKQVVEHSYRTQAVHHYHTEPSSSVAQVEQDGRITVYVGMQNAHRIRREISEALDIPESKLRIIVSKHVGGGYGNRTFVREELFAILLAIKTNRPVRARLTREEVMMASLSRSPCVIKVKDGLDEKGSIVAREITAIYNGGAYTTEGIAVIKNGVLAAVGVYKIPNFKLDIYRVYTNHMEGGAFRGLGYIQILFPIESQMDELAAKIGVNPTDFRLRHILREGDKNAIGDKVHKFAIEDCIKAVTERMSKLEKPTTGWKIGRSIVIGQKACYGGFTQIAYVKYRGDDSIDVITGAFDVGQGVITMISQLVADELRHPLDKVHIVDFDSDNLPVAIGAGGSRQTYYVGSATLRACQDLKRKIFALCSKKLEVSADDLRLENGEVRSKADSSKMMRVRDLFSTGPTAGEFIVGEGELIGRGMSQYPVARLDPVTGQLVPGTGERAVVYYSPVAVGAEVEVDPETGRVNVKRVVVALDAGKAINPKAIEGQIDGCVSMGIGIALYEELVMHNGRVLNPDNKDYKVMLSYDAPHEIEHIILETNFEEGPRGAKGCGELPLTIVPVAITNAITDAVGARIYSLPATAEEVLKMLRPNA